MIETLSTTQSQTTQAHQNPAQKILHRVKNERMGGTIPSWQAPKTPQQKIEHALSNAQNTQTQEASFQNALAYTGVEHTQSAQNNEFGFGDLVDMINPLHHIPIIGYIYREITHDEIKPIGQIVGGALFGGPAGAASGLVNTIIEAETGKDITENTMAMVFNGETPHLNKDKNSPESSLNAAQRTLEESVQNDLPISLLSFTNIKSKQGISIERINTQAHKNQQINGKTLPPREPITQVKLSGLYALGQQ